MVVHPQGALWQRQKILIHCDNQAVIKIWEAGSTCAKETMAFIHLLYYCAARCNSNVQTVHIAGVTNKIADCLSHFQQDKFRLLVPLAIPALAHIRTALLYISKWLQKTIKCVKYLATGYKIWVYYSYDVTMAILSHVIILSSSMQFLVLLILWVSLLVCCYQLDSPVVCRFPGVQTYTYICDLILES